MGPVGSRYGHRSPGRAASRRHCLPALPRRSASTTATMPPPGRSRTAAAQAAPPPCRKIPVSSIHGAGKDKPPPPAPTGPRPTASADGGDEERGKRGRTREEARGCVPPSRGAAVVRERRGVVRSQIHSGQLMTGEDGGLGFAAVNGTVLTLWSRETSPEAWTQRRVVDLKTLLPDYELVDSYYMGLMHRWIPVACVIGFAEGTDIIFVGTLASVYMIELNSGRVRKVLDEFERVYPYMSFYIPAMEAASTAEEPKGSV